MTAAMSMVSMSHALIAIPNANTITDELDTIRGGQLASGTGPNVPNERAVVCIGTGVFHSCTVLTSRRPPSQEKGSPASTKP